MTHLQLRPFLLSGLLWFGICSVAAALPALKIVDGRIVDPEGNSVTLKGCNLGNWLILEPWMFDLPKFGAHDEHGIEAVLAERFGEIDKERLMAVHRDSWITENDFPVIQSFGMNFVRLPFEYQILEDDDRPKQLKPDAFKYLDRCIGWAEKYGMYVLLDLHGAVGRQNKYGHSG
ncbi:MAG: hypothetical protein RLZZ440_2080, partial [Planctomycetota bacterium]